MYSRFHQITDDELRRFFDYLRQSEVIGPEIQKLHTSSAESVTETQQDQKIKICVIESDDLLDQTENVLRAFCTNVGIEYDSKMLEFQSDTERGVQDPAAVTLERRRGLGIFDAAIDSKRLNGSNKVY